MSDVTPTPPEGIEEEHQLPLRGWRRHASPFSLLAFGLVVAIALSGLLGHERDWVAAASGVELRVHGSEVIRNGEFMEMRFHVASDEPIDEPMLAIDATLWEDFTINTMIPAATDEGSRDGELRFSFPRIEAGVPFLWKVDLQINPDIVVGNSGRVTLIDGDEELASTDISISVLP